MVDDQGEVADAAVENASAAVSAAKEQNRSPSGTPPVPGTKGDRGESHVDSSSSDDDDSDAGRPTTKSPKAAKSTLI